jgi:haloalkane dehalogenase
MVDETHDITGPGRRRFLTGAAALSGGALLGSALDTGSVSAAARQRPGGEPGPAVRRTPDSRFRGLPDYPFRPHFVTVAGGDGVGVPLRVHYVDERPSEAAASGETIVLLHGEPSWSYLWRHVIPPLVAAGHRCIAVDLVGMGRSDKPTNRFVYTQERHIAWLREALFDRLELRDVTMVCHDWGGMLGLRLLAENHDRFRRVVATNTGFDTGDEDRTGAWEHLTTWMVFSQVADPFECGQVVEMFTATELDPAVRGAYDAPYPDNSYLEGVRRFPLLIPVSADDAAHEANTAAWQVLQTLQTPFLCAFSDGDHVTHGDHSALSDHIPGAQGQPHATIVGGEHFLQEDRPAELAAVVDAFIHLTS